MTKEFFQEKRKHLTLLMHLTNAGGVEGVEHLAALQLTRHLQLTLHLQNTCCDATDATHSYNAGGVEGNGALAVGRVRQGRLVLVLYSA
jgi:hypothetical protein